MNIRASLILSILVFSFALLLPAAAQEKAGSRNDETVSRVAALDRFHEVVVPMWHEAWPNKNVEMLRSLAPDVEKGIAEIAAAGLPGILREKKKAWDEGVGRLKAAGGAYSAAAAGRDTQALLAAAENLHARYEGLARVLRPALKELDDFHKTLYTLYHVELPAGAIEKIRLSAAVLKTKMDALNKAVLPERWRGKTDAFVAARASLGESLTAMDAAFSTGDEATIKQAVVTMHGRYEALSAVLD